MSPQDDFSLVQGGDCFSHWHSEDRVPTAEFLHGLQSVAKVDYKSVSFTADFRVDFYIVTTTDGPVTATMPPARGNRIVTILRDGGSHNLSIYPTGSETINGTTHLTLTSSYVPVRLLALKGVGYVQV